MFEDKHMHNNIFIPVLSNNFDQQASTTGQKIIFLA